MGVNANLSLPPETKAEDVMNALAALAGNKAVDIPCSNSNGRKMWISCQWPKVAKVHARTSGSNWLEFAYLGFACHNDPLGFDKIGRAHV